MDESLGVRANILLMDADPARAASRCAQFVGFGWLVTPVMGPRDALAAVAAHHIDLAVLLAAPGEVADAELAKALCRRTGQAYLPIIVMCGREVEEGDRCRCLDSGVDEILLHSIGPDELWARMKGLLRVKALQDALSANRQALREALQREREMLRETQADNTRLSRMVTIDPLTRLYNVRYFEKFLADEFKIARRYDQPLSLLALDLDHFKMVNDRYGHPVGDFVLKELSVILTQHVRESDVVARTGGEEFAVVLPRAGGDEAEHFARRIRETVAGHDFIAGGESIKITCSIGSTSYGEDADVTSPAHLVYFADQALMTAKQTGRNRVVPWTKLDDAAKARHRADLRRMLERQQPPAADEAITQAWGSYLPTDE